MSDPLFDLAGRVAVVTGGIGQLGAELSVALASRGMRVAILDLETTPRGGTPGLATALEEGTVRAHACDVTDRAQVESALALVEADWGVPDLLVNAAAIDAPPDAPAAEVGPFEDVPVESLERVVHVNVLGVVVPCQVIGGAMARAGRGSIVNVGSVYGLLSPDQGLYDFRREAGDAFYKPVAYSVSKSALVNLTRYLATYWGRSGVRVNTLTPHGIENGQPAPFVEAFAARSPLGRLMDVSEAVGAVVFLASDALVVRHRGEPRRRRRLVGLVIPAEVPNLVAGEERPPASGAWLEKTRPADGADLCRVARSGSADADAAVAAAREAQVEWGARTAVERGDVVRAIAALLRERREEASEIVAAETGKGIELARGETDAAVEMGFFVAGEGRRSYGRTTTASMPHRTVLTLRRPVGVAALLISFNTPLPNVAWKAFPSIFCGNGSVLKPSEHTPVSAWWLGRLCLEAGLPPGVLNVVQGLGPEAGMPLVEDPRVDLVSFTGSAATGRLIAEAAGRRLAKTVMELGGKNALVVCDDADLDRAVEWTLASAFSNAGQRCAAASRIVVFDAVYDDFRERLARATWALGDIGPVISEAAMDRILAAVEAACAGGAVVLAGGARVGEQGFHVAPTLVEGVAPDAPLSCEELFGPVAALYRVAGFDEAVALANDSAYGLTAAIHTASVHRAMRFAERVAAGVVVVNAGTHGSEPHMGFGGVKQSGTGWKEAGLESLDVYSETRYVNLVVDPALT